MLEQLLSGWNSELEIMRKEKLKKEEAHKNAENAVYKFLEPIDIIDEKPIAFSVAYHYKDDSNGWEEEAEYLSLEKERIRQYRQTNQPKRERHCWTTRQSTVNRGRKTTNDLARDANKKSAEANILSKDSNNIATNANAIAEEANVKSAEANTLSEGANTNSMIAIGI